MEFLRGVEPGRSQHLVGYPEGNGIHQEPLPERQ
jgi:hypothetical protein